ncbi:type II toxin-antitoxin system VapC family toxin [Bosea sp. LjRoot237]|uniref:type II toxin-antitoxin system VapC family toxin n=1 Tax=Bosea sp. LjRoot237 TaxID=3342292 RepID=UPI003ECD8882
MRLLLDSHVLLWWSEATSDRLRADARVMIDNADDVCVSVASVWELEIKRMAGRLDLGAFRWEMLEEHFVEVISIDRDDALAAASLPPVHSDPFDRMIVAQAMRRGATLVTADGALGEYGVAILKA